jgi:PAS domain S-box-containing protein
MTRVLVVDDRAVNRHFLVNLLGYCGYQLSEAADGAEALEAIRRAPPDLVITDLLMPVMDGEELVRRMKAEGRLASIPVIFYTATYSASDARGIADGCGVQAVLAKPSEPETILATVSEVLGPAALPAMGGGVGGEEQDTLKAILEGGRAASEALPPLALKLASLVEFGMSVTGVLDLDALLEELVAAAQDILGVRYAGAGLLDNSGKALARFAARGIPRTPALPAAREGVLGEVLASGRPRLVVAAGTPPGSLGLPSGHPPVWSLLVVPMVARTGLLGWLYLADPPVSAPFDGVAEQLATTLASQFAVAAEAARLQGEIQGHAGQLRKEIADRQAAQDLFRQMAETIEEVFWVSEPGEKPIKYVSPAFERVWGIPAERLYEKPGIWLDAIHPTDRPRVVEAIGRGEESGAYDETYRIVRPDTSMRWVRDRAFPVRDASGKVVRMFGIAEDVSRGKDLELQVQQAMKMEAVGRLAGGVAHDFNNLLMVILGQSSLILPRVAADEKARRGLEDIQEAGQRAAGLTRQLLAFSRKQVLQPRLLDTNEVVRNLQRILARMIGEDVILHAELASGAWPILADAGQVEQVVMNLAVNARDAMPRGGRLTMETKNVRLAKSPVHDLEGLPTGDYLCLAVSDTGTGMDEEVRKRVFEPFYTTKEKGTGLGLATVYGIVRQSGGTVTVYSEPGQGTTFKVYLPRAILPGAPRTDDLEGGELPTGTETVLLVEDEEAVRKLARLLLEAQGYTVIEATSGPGALEVLAGGRVSIQLLLTDTIMPVMSGRELAQKAQAARPDLKVIYMSGYTDDAVVRHGVLSQEVAFLQKPFTPLDLARKVRGVLDGRGPTKAP